LSGASNTAIYAAITAAQASAAAALAVFIADELILAVAFGH
jgi:hypothetical protein